MPHRATKAIARAPTRTAVTMLVALAASGCATWQAMEDPPQQVFRDSRPSKVRVTTSDGEQTVLDRPRIARDVVAGFDEECIDRFGRDSNECPELGFAVFEITVFEVYRRGWAAIFLPAVGGLTLAWLLANR